MINYDAYCKTINFLNESNRIEGIKEIDYAFPDYQDPEKGHYGAFISSQHLAVENRKSKAPLTVKDIKNWQKLITLEQRMVGVAIDDNEVGVIRGPNLEKNVRIGNHIPPSYKAVPALLSFLVEDINQQLPKIAENSTDEEYCKFISSSFHEFERIHPFGDGNGRVGRIIANYIAKYCDKPLIVFSSEMIEKNEYYRAHESAKKMNEFFAKKIKEINTL